MKYSEGWMQYQTALDNYTAAVIELHTMPREQVTEEHRMAIHTARLALSRVVNSILVLATTE